MTNRSQPTANEVRAAVVAAARFTGEDPMDAFDDGDGAPCARALAFAALFEVYPEQEAAPTAILLNYPSADTAKWARHAAKRQSWWDEAWLDDVVGALVADRYGARGR